MAMQLRCARLRQTSLCNYASALQKFRRTPHRSNRIPHGSRHGKCTEPKREAKFVEMDQFGSRRIPHRSRRIAHGSRHGKCTEPKRGAKLIERVSSDPLGSRTDPVGSRTDPATENGPNPSEKQNLVKWVDYDPVGSCIRSCLFCRKPNEIIVFWPSPLLLFILLNKSWGDPLGTYGGPALAVI